MPTINFTLPLQSLTRYTRLRLYRRVVLNLPAFILGLRLEYIYYNYTNDNFKIFFNGFDLKLYFSFLLHQIDIKNYDLLSKLHTNIIDNEGFCRVSCVDF